MIVKISQTASNIKQLYEIDGDGFYYDGKLGSFSRFQEITMSNAENTLKGVFKESDRINYIPFLYLFGKSNRTRKLRLYKNDEYYEKFIFSRHGYLKSFYVITLKSGEKFYCYVRGKDSFAYISIYKDNMQVALIETYLTVVNAKYTHKLYILDLYNQYADVLSFFVLYYANYTFTNRFHMGSGTYYGKSCSFSKYNDKYDPAWREEHFPNENFFGKTNLFSD